MNGVAIDSVRIERAGFALGPVDLDIPSGTATVILGPSGAGKTTLLRGLAGFLPLRTGAIRIDGESVESLPPERRRFGFVPPSLGLLPHLRVDRNVRYPLYLRGDPRATASAQYWVERFDLVRLARKYPHELSSGERQRVAMARALASEPRFLLWDEPLSALDVDTRDTLLRLLRELIEREHLPLLLVTHDPTTAIALASRWVVLETGRVRYSATPEAVAHGPLDRFTARFLGYENLLSPEELREAADTALGPRLASVAGPGGVVVPPEAIAYGPVASRAGSAAVVSSVRWTPTGWSVGLAHGRLVFRVTGTQELPPVHMGEPVALDIDLAKVKPLEGFRGAS